MKAILSLTAFAFCINVSAAANLKNPVALGGTNLYCKISSVNQVGPNGELIRVSQGKLHIYDKAEGSDFIVDRDTGQMLGQYVTTSNSWWDIKVLSYGDDQMSYKMFAENQYGYKYAQYMEVAVWHDTERKPFVLVNTDTFLGYCTFSPPR